MSWQELEGATIESYTLARRYLDAIPGSSEDAETSVAVEPSGSYNVAFEDLPPGRHEFSLTYTRGDGTTGQVSAVTATVPLQQTVSVNGPFPNPASGGRTTLRVAVSDGQVVQLELFDSIGRLVGRSEANLDENRPTNLQLGSSGTFRLNELASGVYFVRVSGREFTETRQLVVVK